MENVFNSSNKILFIRLSSLGDVLLTLPTLTKIRNKFPEKEIGFIVNKNFSDAVKYHPAVKNVYEYEKEEPEKILDDLPKNYYEFIVDLQNNHRSKQIINILNLPHVSYSKPNFKKFLLVHFKINLFSKINHVAQLYASTISSKLTVTPDDFNFYLPEGVATLKPVNNKICFCPGAKHFTKRYPVEYFIELAKLLENQGFDVHLLGGKDDANLCEKIASNSGAINKVTENDLFETARELSTCSVAVCNDTGLMHLATAVGAPVIAIFGSSVKEFGFTPFARKSLLLENNSLSCRPCSHIGRSKCLKKHFKCMLELKPEFVFNQIMNFVDKND